MWNFIMRSVFVLILYCLQNGLIVRAKDWNVTFLDESVSWKFENESAPYPADNITQRLVFIDDEIQLEVYGSLVKENFTKVLFAIPYKERFSECPHNNFTMDSDLRQHYWVQNISVSNFKYCRTTYRNIFTGCYYTVMINGRGEKFLVGGPKFYSTNYTFNDNRLKMVRETKVVPEDALSRRELKTTITVARECIQVIAWLYQWKGEIEDDKNDLVINEVLKNTSSVTYQCIIKIDDMSKTFSDCGASDSAAKPKLEVSKVVKTNHRRKIDTIWRNLPRGPSTYYLEFETDMSRCDQYAIENHLPDDIRTWIPRATGHFDKLGRSSESNEPGPLENNNPILSAAIVIAVIVSIILIVTLICWISKYARVAMKKYHRSTELIGTLRVTTSLQSEKESDQILLLYGHDPSLLMDEIDKMKRCFKENLASSTIHDVYATNDWDRISELGVAGWVQELLKEGSKIVWVDTPEFRSCLKNKQKQYIPGDFRADAIPYAVSVAMDSFQNPATQYRRHFVVRVKGFQVEDGDEDPLQVITPHARYCIPEQLPLLCEHLRSSPERVTMTEVEKA